MQCKSETRTGSFFGPPASFVAQLGLPCHLERARAVGLHDLRLEVRAGTQVASRQVHCGLGRDWLLLLLSLLLLQAREFLPLAHLQHLVLGGAHHLAQYIGRKITTPCLRSDLHRTPERLRRLQTPR